MKPADRTGSTITGSIVSWAAQWLHHAWCEVVVGRSCEAGAQSLFIESNVQARPSAKGARLIGVDEEGSVIGYNLTMRRSARWATLYRKEQPMRNEVFLSVTIFVLALASTLVNVRPARAQQVKDTAQLESRIDRLIQQLDDDKFEVREKAEAQLAAIGEVALAKLIAATKDTAPERKERAEKLVKRIREGRTGLQYLSSIER